MARTNYIGYGTVWYGMVRIRSDWIGLDRIGLDWIGSDRFVSLRIALCFGTVRYGIERYITIHIDLR